MLNRTEALSPELTLLLACSRTNIQAEDERPIREMLAMGIEWTDFARKAVDHGLASLVGFNLARVAPELVPDDILEALSANLKVTRERNRALLDELSQVFQALSGNGIAAIPFRGPTLAIQAYGDIGLRVFRELDFLVRDGDLRPAVAIMMERGYRRIESLTDAQTARIQRLHGQDFLLNKKVNVIVEPHTRLIPIKMAFDIDYDGLWRRAQDTAINGATILMMAPEDVLLALSIHGGKGMWRSLKWAADVAAFIQSHPALDWKAVIERARRQGCLRTLVLATALAQQYFASALAQQVFEVQHADSGTAAMVRRIASQWQSDTPARPPGDRELSLDRLRLHDGVLRRARYAARTLLLPDVEHVRMVPLHQVWRFALAQTERCKNVLIDSEFPLALSPLSASAKSNARRYRELRKGALRALSANPNDAAVWMKLADLMFQFGRKDAAIECYDSAVAIEPESGRFWEKRRVAIIAMGRTPYLPVRARQPQSGEDWTVRASGLLDLQQFAEAAEAAERALVLQPGNRTAARTMICARMLACDWRRHDDDKQRLASALHEGEPLTPPIYYRCISDSESENLKIALAFAKTIPVPPPESTEPNKDRVRRLSGEKIRLAYISSDFRNHAVCHAIASCIENHDRSRFETVAISLRDSDGSEMRRRMNAAFDRFIDVQTMSDMDVAMMLRNIDIQIAVDMNGYTSEYRPGIFAHRPAPVQVNYLGYPGTTALTFMDYIIADRLVIPEEHRKFYTECVAYLPDCYLPADNTRLVDGNGPSRSGAGLPETGFVFACFNAEAKITPEIFHVWMQLLGAVENSVLWLKAVNGSAMLNLRREARHHGIGPERIIFAPWLPEMRNHLGRLSLADLFLDTLPYNAHVTTCDALWAGAPVLTCLGNAFQGRVAASLLHAIGLPELVTTSLADYRELALTLARSSDRLAAIRARLMHNRLSQPLFDSARYTRHLESAFTTMWEQHQRGEPPVSFAVGAAPLAAKLPGRD